MPCAFIPSFVVLLVAACSPAARPIVSEVYYDAPGDDTGQEFVEIFNPLAHDVALAGLELDAGDGAAPGRWTRRWIAPASDTVRARSRFVVGGAKVTPAPDAVVTLELQNGPDAMRLVWPDGATEVVGWGALAFAEYYCGSPAPDVDAGFSLARVPDDAALGSNALDFRAAAPSPGRANQPPADLALARGTLALAPDAPDPGAAVAVTFAVIARGAQPVLAGSASCALAGDALAAEAAWTLPAMAPGETLRVTRAAVAGAAGRRSLVARVTLAADAAPDNDADTLAVRVGPGPLEVTEIQFHPRAGEGEWVEVRNRSSAPLALDAFTFSDRADGRASVGEAADLPADSLALLAQDRAALLAAFAGLDATRVAEVSPWPSLNNTNAADGFADIVTLRERDGLPSDRVAYSASGVPAGATLEKSGGAWRVSAAPAGTPLAPPRAACTGAASLTVAPRRVTAESPRAQVAWRLPWERASVSVALYDLAGRRVAGLLGETDSAGSGERTVNFAGVPPGLYAVVLRAHSDRDMLERTALLRLAGPRP